MSWWIYFDKGRCNDGDHENDLIEYPTEDAARVRIAELKKTGEFDGICTGTITLIHGDEVEQ